MSELDELIARIRARLQEKNSFSQVQENGKTYGDQKIIITARQMKNFRPPEIREMRRLAQSRESIRWSDSRLFYEQAKFMENYTDDKLYEGSFDLYYPTYQRMSENQLRGYFTWRTQARKGIFLKESVSFWFIYIYETLHLIGAGSPENGAVILDRIWQEAPAVTVKARIADWAMDYCAYYGADPALFRCLEDRVKREKYIGILSNCSEASDSGLYEAMTELSVNNTARSVLVRDHREEYIRLSCMILRSIAARYEKRTGKRYADSMFSRQNAPYREMFRNAVFFDHLAPRAYSCNVTAVTQYTCRGMIWSWSGPGRLKGNDDLKLILHEADNLLRKHYGYTNLLKESEWSKEKKTIAAKAAEELFRNKALEERRRVEFDMSLLEGIRSAADEMRERLIVPGSEEEFRDDDAPGKDTEQVIGLKPETESDVPAGEKGPAAEELLSGEEAELLRHLITGLSAVRGQERMRISLLCDSINEKLYDIFGDTVIEFDGDLPVIMEEYLDSIKELISEDT